MTTYFKLIIVFFFILGCSKQENKTCDLKPVIERDIKVNTKNSTSYLISKVKDKKLLILGETHYVQEHQEYVSCLIDSLRPFGYTTILVEGSSHAFDWMVQDYVNGEIQYIPNYIRLLDNYWIEKIRKINSTISDSQKYEFHLIDLNHGLNIFPTSLTEMEKIINHQSLFDQIKTYEFDSENYKNELNKVELEIKNNELYYSQLWGDKWYNRIIEMFEIEIRSSKFRTTKDEFIQDTIRESIMIENINRHIKENPDKKFILNVGMWHAQKQNMMIPYGPTLGEYFANMYNQNIYNIAFVGIRGKRRANISDNTIIDFNLLNSTDECDLINIIGSVSVENMSFLELSDEIFIKNIEVSYTSDRTYYTKSGLQFNAVLSYPTISVLKSLTQY